MHTRTPRVPKRARSSILSPALPCGPGRSFQFNGWQKNGTASADLVLGLSWALNERRLISEWLHILTLVATYLMPYKNATSDFAAEQKSVVPTFSRDSARHQMEDNGCQSGSTICQDHDRLDAQENVGTADLRPCTKPAVPTFYRN